MKTTLFSLLFVWHFLCLVACAVIEPIENGESFFDVRTKMNAAIDLAQSNGDLIAAMEAEPKLTDVGMTIIPVEVPYQIRAELAGNPAANGLYTRVADDSTQGRYRWQKDNGWVIDWDYGMTFVWEVAAEPELANYPNYGSGTLPSRQAWESSPFDTNPAPILTFLYNEVALENTRLGGALYYAPLTDAIVISGSGAGSLAGEVWTREGNRNGHPQYNTPTPDSGIDYTGSGWEIVFNEVTAYTSTYDTDRPPMDPAAWTPTASYAPFDTLDYVLSDSTVLDASATTLTVANSTDSTAPLNTQTADARYLRSGQAAEVSDLTVDSAATAALILNAGLQVASLTLETDGTLATSSPIEVPSSTAAATALNTQTADLRFGCKVGTATASGASTSINCATATSWTITLSSATTLSITGLVSGYDAAIKLRLVQDATGGRIVFWPAGTRWEYGQAPILSTDAGAVDVVWLTTTDGGATFDGYLAASNLAEVE